MEEVPAVDKFEKIRPVRRKRKELKAEVNGES